VSLFGYALPFFCGYLKFRLRYDGLQKRNSGQGLISLRQK